MTNPVPNITFKVIGLVASIVTILACFIAAVTWISTGMAENSVSIKVLREGQLRNATLIVKNSEVSNQNRQLLTIIKQHAAEIESLNKFMTEGGRFTEQDGRVLHEELEGVKDRLQHYEVLETELGWIKRSMARIETDIAKRFEGLHKKLDVR